MNLGRIRQSATHQPRTGRRLQRLIRSIGIIQFVLISSLLLTIIVAGVSMNRQALQSQATLIEFAIDRSIQQVLSEQKSVAFWDVAVAKLAGPKLDEAWANSEIGGFLENIYGHHSIYVLDPNGYPVYAWHNGKQITPGFMPTHRGVVMPLLGELGNHAYAAENLRKRDFSDLVSKDNAFPGANMGKWSGHLMKIGGKPFIVGVISITATENARLNSSAPHYLVSIVEFDQALVSKLGQTRLIDDLILAPPTFHDADFAAVPLKTDDGDTVGVLRWQAAKPGQILLVSVLPLTVIASLLAAWAFRNLVQRLSQSTRELVVREAHSRHLALHDTLSGLPNRRAFIQYLEQHAELEPEGGLAIAYLDLDRFKDLNDTLGHSFGDELIRQVGSRLKNGGHPDDVVARFGGDEFAIMRVLRDEAMFLAFGDSLISHFHEPFDVNGHSVKISASIGITRAAQATHAIDTLMREADIALHDAKSGGRSKIACFEAGMARRIEERVRIETELRKAITGKGLRMVYQPLIDCRTRKISGVEALIRWHHAELGHIAPSTFIPIAESAGLMLPLGRFITEAVLRDARRWPELEIAFNLSPVQILDTNIVSLLEKLTDSYGINRKRVALEITEGVLLDSGADVVSTLGDLRKLGFKLAIDDFGTGYSSLIYLRQFQFDKLKIDRSFVRNIEQTDDAVTIVQAIVSLAQGLGMETVAEGVETEAEAELMREAGCDQWQGYYFARPMEAEAIDAFFRESHAGPATLSA